MAVKIKTNKPKIHLPRPGAPLLVSFTAETKKVRATCFHSESLNHFWPQALNIHIYEPSVYLLFQNLTPISWISYWCKPLPNQLNQQDLTYRIHLSFDARNEMVAWRFQPDRALETLTQPAAFMVLLCFKPEFVKGISLKGFISGGKKITP